MKKNQGDGTLNNLTTNYSILITLMLIALQGCSSTPTTEDIVSCFTSKTQLSVAKIDEKNYRLFAIARESISLKKRLQSSQECFTNTNWSNNWRISVFSSHKYAGYKDEPNIIPLHVNNNWAKAYLVEYIGSKNEYISMPAIQP